MRETTRSAPLAELDAYLPRSHWVTRHTRVIQATPEVVAQAFADLTVGELRLTRPLWALRGLPARLSGSGPDSALPPRARMWDAMVGTGFLPLAGIEQGVAVMGFAGQPWRPHPGAAIRRDLGAAQFGAFSEPRHLKGVTGTAVRPHPRGALLVTETRVYATDASAARRFWPYWQLIRPFSGLIRADLLAATARRAERAGA